MKQQTLSALGRRTQEPPISWLMSMALGRPGLISLAAGFTDSQTLPTAQVRALMNEILGSPRQGRAALQYGTTVGEPRLRQLSAQRICALDGAPAKAPLYAAERMVLTNGSQQMLYLVSEALCDAGDIVLVEDPTYFVYLSILQSHGLRARGVQLDADGLNLEHLDEVLAGLQRRGELKRVKLLYLVSYYQNPTGRTTSFEKKTAILRRLRACERAAGHPIYLLEDAAYRELQFEGEPVQSALAAGELGERVIYSGTYSKPFATGSRVGFGLLPEPLFTTVVRIKGNHDFGSSNLLQQLLARAIASGRYEEHVAGLRRRYARKAAVMLQAMREHFPEPAQWETPEGGLYFWVQLPGSTRSGARSKLFQTALANEVLYVPGELCYAEDPARPKPNHELRLSFGAASEARIRAGIQRLGKAFGDLFKGS